MLTKNQEGNEQWLMVNLHFVLHVIKHYWSATRIDVLHSPFVYELYNRCLARQKTPAELHNINAVWRKARRNKTLITQQDFGASGKTVHKRTRPISYFAKTHAKPGRLAQIIFRLVNHYHYQHCIELGTSLGFTSMHIAAALTSPALLTTIEGAPELAQVAEQHFIATYTKPLIKQVVGEFNEVLPQVLQQYNQVDFAFIDGNHTYEATMNYFNQFLQKIHANSVLIFDDIYWSSGMTRAWNEIKQHEQVTVTVDLFFVGLVYFRKGQAKEHFKLRIF